MTTASGQTRSKYLKAVLLPAGTSEVALWIVDGRITFTPQPDAALLTEFGGFATAGLVDAHTHLHFVPEGHAKKTGRELVNENRRLHLEMGTLLLRDVGATSEDV